MLKILKDKTRLGRTRHKFQDEKLKIVFLNAYKNDARSCFRMINEQSSRKTNSLFVWTPRNVKRLALKFVSLKLVETTRVSSSKLTHTHTKLASTYLVLEVATPHVAKTACRFPAEYVGEGSGAEPDCEGNGPAVRGLRFLTDCETGGVM